MSTLIAVVVAAVASAVSAALLVLRPPGRPRAVNRRGRRLPVVLGLAVVAGAVAGAVAGWVVTEEWVRWERARWVWAGGLLVFLAGLADDLFGRGPRGLRAHARALARGQVTTGAVKLVAAVGGGILAVLAFPGRSLLDRALGVLLVAGSANLWNGLDVAPGRAVKGFLPVAAALLAVRPAGAVAPLLAGALGGAVGVGVFDLRERAMLGDSGANLLGFAAGAALYAVLPLLGVAVAAAGIVALNLAAETVTLSRLIESVPPLRWADGAGRADRG